jgi:DNA-binding MarR family transcriptional regulator
MQYTLQRLGGVWNVETKLYPIIMIVPNSTSISILHLLHRAGQCADELFAANFGQDLTPRQYEVLKTVLVSDSPSQTYLVDQTGIDRSTLADIVRRLVQRGLLQRKRTRQDARRYAVKLTEKGRAMLESAEPAVDRTCKHLLAGLPNGDREALVHALHQIVAAARA